MNNVIDIYISKIYTIIKKEETESFHFINNERKWDGFVLFTEGEGYFIDRNNARGTFSKGTILPLTKGDNYELHSIGPCSYVTAAYDLNYSEKTAISSLPVKVNFNEALTRKIVEISELWQSHTWDSYILCRSRLLKMYYELYRLNEDQNAQTDETIVKAKQYIHENFGNSFSFPQLCHILSISPSYLRAKFKNHTGITISEYRDNLRIDSAKEMLESGLFSLKEIAFALGYCDPYHFSKAFKKSEGISPGRVKERQGNKTKLYTKAQ